MHEGEKSRRTQYGIAKTRQVMLTVTRYCNLACRYCYESFKDRTPSRKMSVEMAKQLIVSEFANVLNDGITEGFDISFMGGEPLANFELIREASEWMWKKEWPLPYELSFPTNGTLLTPEMRQWLIANKHRISVGLSFDGLQGVNEINRTTLPVEWKFFVDNWPDRRIAVVLFPDSISLLAKNVRAMNQAGIPFMVVFGEGFDWTSSAVETYEHQMMELMPDYLDNPDEARASGLFSLKIQDLYPSNLLHTSPFCGAVDNIVNYDVDGQPYICHIFAPATLGQEKAERARERYRDLKTVPWDPVCDHCALRNVCKPCFGFHVKLHDDVNQWSAKHTICALLHSKARVCSYYQLKRIERTLEQGGELSEEDLLRSSKAVRFLEEHAASN